MEPIWKYNEVPAASNFIIAVYFAVAFVAARFLLDRFIYRRLATWLLGRGTNQLKLNETTRAKIVKCSESMWKLTYYATVEFSILATLYHEPWFIDVKHYYIGWPDHELKLSLKLIYMCQCGFYIYSIAALLMWETRRKDFSVMMSHHVVTVILIGFSYISRFFRIGAVILALHDASDVFLEAAKAYILSILGHKIIKLLLMPSLAPVRALLTNIILCLQYDVITLLVFHIYWWKLIWAMIMKQLKSRGKVGEDIRSGTPSFYFVLVRNDSLCLLIVLKEVAFLSKFFLVRAQEEFLMKLVLLS
ncbi:UNVERIFIED_CONTAM: LAG1 longevity assurance2 [Sesamum angustifolium]|uniref:LAG1 longevity assurance2 n=1 Tax=Sesamum angustifolium TaxID=2727405 RepID=A0AAW2QCE8_9LAMI